MKLVFRDDYLLYRDCAPANEFNFQSTSVGVVLEFTNLFANGWISLRDLVWLKMLQYICMVVVVFNNFNSVES